MFKDFRKKNTTDKLLTLIGGVIGIALILTLIMQIPSLLKPKNYAGEIFGKKITAEQFQNAYQHNLILTKFRYGNMFEKLEPILNLNEQTWDQLILLQEAKKQKIKVTNAEVISSIAEYKIFFRKNKFDDLIYKQIIRASLQTNVKNFEDAVRDSLIIAKLKAKITAPITFSSPQIQEEFKKQNTKAKVSYVEIPASNYKKDITLSDEELLAYYKKNKHDFLIPPTIKVDYIRADYPKDAGIQKQVETKFKAKAIVKEYKTNPDFKALAKKFKFSIHESDYFSRKQFGFPLGNTEDGQGVKIDEAYDLLKNMFSLEVGQVVEPVEWKKGYLVLKLKEKRPSYIPKFAEAKEKIIAILTQKKARAIAKVKANEYLTQIKNNKDFISSAESLKLKINQSSLLPQKQLLLTLGIKKESENELFNLKKINDLSNVTATQNGFIIFKLDELIPADMKKFAKNSQAFAENLMEEKKEEAYNNFLEDLYEKANLKRFASNDFSN